MASLNTVSQAVAVPEALTRSMITPRRNFRPWKFELTCGEAGEEHQRCANVGCGCFVGVLVDSAEEEKNREAAELRTLSIRNLMRASASEPLSTHTLLRPWKVNKQQRALLVSRRVLRKRGRGDGANPRIGGGHGRAASRVGGGRLGSGPYLRHHAENMLPIRFYGVLELVM